MVGFEESLQAFLNGSLDLAGLKQSIQRDVLQDPAASARIQGIFQEMYRTGRLPQPLFMELMQSLGAYAAAPSPSEPRSHVPPPQDPDRTVVGRVTRIPEDKTRVAGMPDDADRTRVATPTPTPPPPADPDATRITSWPKIPPATPPDDGDITRITIQPGYPPRQEQTGSNTAGFSRGFTDSSPSQSAFTGANPRTQPTAGTGRMGTDASWGGSMGDAETSEPLAPGALLKHRFVLESIVGRGGMGLVFKARDLRKEEAQDRNPYVAVKVLSEEFKRHPESLKALQREARKAQNLAHPNIVNVFDFDRDGGNVYMTMEYMDGTPLDQYIKRTVGQGLPFKEALPLIRDMAHALAYAHAKSVVHSDFKPGNAFLTHEGVVKVFDFGIARAAKHAETAQGETTLFDAGNLGALTPAYASVEMLEGEEPDPRDDIYALACVAYELLTGRHPFNKTPANTARDQKLVPAPIKGLSRRQWRGLLKGLAFERNKRSQSVEQFLADIGRRNVGRGAAIGGFVAVVAVAALGALVIPQYLDERNLQRLTDSLKSSDTKVVEAALQEIAGLSAEQRDKVVGAAREDILAFYEQQIEYHINTNEGRYNFDEAIRLHERAHELYPDSAKLDDLIESVTNRKNQLLSDIDTRFKSYLAAGKLLPDEGLENIPALLAIVVQIQADHPLLKDKRLPGAYAEAASKAYADEDILRADRLVSAGLERFADDAMLINMRDKITSVKARVLREQRVAELADELQKKSSSLRALDEFKTVSQPLAELRELAPEHPVLASIQSALEAAVAQNIQTSIGKRDWNTPIQTLEELADILDSEFARAQRSKLTTAQQGHQQQIDRVLAEVTTAVAARRLDGTSEDNAIALLEELTQIGADQRSIDQAKASIAQGYLIKAREARGKGDWNTARDTVNAGVRFAEGMPVQNTLRAELDEIARAENYQQQKMADAERQKLEQERAQKIAELNNAFESNLKKSDFSAADARAALASLDNIAALDPALPVVSQGRGRVAERVAAVADAMSTQGQWEQAQGLLRDSLQLLPESKRLVDLNAKLEQGHQQQLAQTKQADIEQRRARIDALLGNVKSTPEWEKELLAEIKRLEGLVPAGDAFVVKAHERLAAAYLAQAKGMREVQRFVEAESLLQKSQRLAPKLPGLDVETAALAQAVDAFKAENAEKSRLALIEGLKQTLQTQAKANNVKEANKTLAELRTAAPDDSFLKEQAPQILGDAYLRLAEKAANRGQFDSALKLANAGLEAVPGLATLETAVQRYTFKQKVAEVGKRFAQSDTLDPSSAKREIQTLVAEQPAEEKAIRKQLAAVITDRVQTLAKRNAEAATKYLAAARELFPDDPSLAELTIDQPTDTETAQAEPEPKATDTPTQTPAATSAEAPAATAPTTTAPAQVATAPTVTKRPATGQCSAQLAGYGTRSRAVCYDFLNDEARGPLLVVVPAGGGHSSPFAITKHEISVADYSQYCKLSGECSGLGGGATLPATGISYQNAQRYAAWLSKTTGFDYRIPTDQEWVHAAEAGGKQPDKDFNCQLRLGDSLVKGQSMLDVRSGKSNGWGLINYVGNAQEWVQSGGGVTVRGGAYADSMSSCDIALSKPHSGQADELTGFRLVRSLEGKS